MPCPHCDGDHLNRLICDDCGDKLTDEERHYYAGRCEECEREHHAALAYWRAGGCNPAFDAMFGSDLPKSLN